MAQDLRPIQTEGTDLPAAGEHAVIGRSHESDERLAASEQRYRTLAEVLPSQVWTARPDGSLDYVNQRVLDYFGRTFDEMVGADWQDGVHPDDLAPCLQRWTHSLETGTPYEVEFRLRRARDGSYRWHLGRAEAVRDPSGAITHWIGTNTDVDDAKRSADERTRAERDLVEKERRLRLALDAGQMGTWEWDIVTGAVHWSDTLERIRGIPVGSFPGTFEAYQRDMHPEDKDRVVAAVRSALAERRDHSILYRIIRPDGAMRWLEAYGRFTLDAKGEPIRLGGVCRDVTERITADEARTALAAEQAARVQAEEARRNTQQILEGITDSFAVFDREWRFVFANQATTRELGLAPDAVFGKNVWELLPKAVGTRFFRELDQAMRSGQPLTIEDHYAPADKWFELRAYPLESIGLAVYARDVTPRKREGIARERAEENARRLMAAQIAKVKSEEATRRAEFLAEAGVALAASLDFDATTEHLAGLLVPAMADVAAIDLVEGDGSLRRMSEAAPEPHVERALQELGPVVSAGGDRRTISYRVLDERRTILIPDFDEHALSQTVSDPTVAAKVRRDLDPRSVLAVPMILRDTVIGVINLVYSSSGRRYGADDVLLAEDIARRATLALDNARLYRKAQIAVRARDEVLAVVAHDLRNPLGVFRLVLVALRHVCADNLRGIELINKADRAYARMIRLLDDLLDVARIDAGTLTVERESVDLTQVLAEVVDFQRSLAADKNIPLDLELPRVSLPAKVDRERFAQLMGNLLGNAVKFTKEGGRIVVRATHTSRHVLIEVIDSGVGIHPDHIDHVFDRFWQTRERKVGVGLGLAIAKGIVEAHGGTIAVTSAGVGCGTHLSLTIPTDDDTEPDHPRTASSQG